MCVVFLPVTELNNITTVYNSQAQEMLFLTGVCNFYLNIEHFLYQKYKILLFFLLLLFKFLKLAHCIERP